MSSIFNEASPRGEKSIAPKGHLITAALPYANGPLHFGHLAGAYLPADVYNRHQKLLGRKTLFISGSDEHGVAIMLGAQRAEEDYQSYVNRWHRQHQEFFQLAGVEFDFFGQTSAPYHREEVLKWFEALQNQGLIEQKVGQQLFCSKCQNHLPDRFVEGQCYACGHDKARGDECPQCGELICPERLKNPICKMCGARDIKLVDSTQHYLMLSRYHREFRSWLKDKESLWRKTVFPYVDELSRQELQDRAITRDLDWGIDVPRAPGKTFYVWFDAPIGYVSNTKECSSEDWWTREDVKITNFLGKDNIIFHAVIFPVMSLATGRARPVDDVVAGQFLNFEGGAFSKSEGAPFDAVEALKTFGQDAIRYYLLSILPEGADSTFSWKEFPLKVNGELANNIGNLAARSLKFLVAHWPEGLPQQAASGFQESDLGRALKDEGARVRELLESHQIRKAQAQVMAMGQRANLFFTQRAPWQEVKVHKSQAAQTLAYGALCVACLGVFLAPLLPELSKKMLAPLGGPKLGEDWKKRVYAGDFKALEEVFQGGTLTLPEELPPLVPKILC